MIYKRFLVFKLLMCECVFSLTLRQDLDDVCVFFGGVVVVVVATAVPSPVTFSQSFGMHTISDACGYVCAPYFHQKTSIPFLFPLKENFFDKIHWCIPLNFSCTNCCWYSRLSFLLMYAMHFLYDFLCIGYSANSLDTTCIGSKQSNIEAKKEWWGRDRGCFFWINSMKFSALMTSEICRFIRIGWICTRIHLPNVF